MANSSKQRSKQLKRRCVAAAANLYRNPEASTGLRPEIVLAPHRPPHLVAQMWIDFALHPERHGRKIDKSESHLIFRPEGMLNVDRS